MNIITLIEDAATNPNLDAALAPIMDRLDPRNERDLGGEAGVWFSDIADKWAGMSTADRHDRLARFINYIRA